MIHPRLAPVDTDVPARHGTVYARYGYGCECADCLPCGRSRPVASFGGLLTSATWHINNHLLGLLVVAAIMWLLFRAYYEQWAAHPAARRAILLLLDASAAVVIFTAISLAVASLVAQLRPRIERSTTA
jgi:hypothetical protein